MTLKLLNFKVCILVATSRWTTRQIFLIHISHFVPTSYILYIINYFRTFLPLNITRSSITSIFLSSIYPLQISIFYEQVTYGNEISFMITINIVLQFRTYVQSLRYDGKFCQHTLVMTSHFHFHYEVLLYLNDFHAV